MSKYRKKIKQGKGRYYLVAGGTSSGIKKGHKFKIAEVEMITVEGKSLAGKKEIGQIKIVNIEDESFSQGEIISGAKEITEKLEANVPLKAILIE